MSEKSVVSVAGKGRDGLMKIQDLGLFALLISGGGLMLVGGSMMYMQPSNDTSGIMTILGLLFFIPGIVIAVIGVFSWLAAKPFN